MLYTICFFAFSAGIILLNLWYALQRRWREGMWVVWLMSLLILPGALRFVPTGGFVINFPMVAGLSCLISYLVSPVPLPRYRFMISDVAAVLAPIAILASQFSHNEQTPMSIPSAFCQWLLPYVMGRIFLVSADDIPKVSRIVGGLCVVNALIGLFEAVTHVSLSTKLLGVWYLTEGGRFGMSRAHNFFGHPITMGQVMVMMLPWCLVASRKTSRSRIGKWFYPGMNLLAIVTTLTRGAILGFFESLYLIAFTRSRHRFLMGLALAVAAAGLVLGEEMAISVIASMGGEDETGNSMIFIEGEPYMYNSARHRILQYKVFAVALRDAGMTGLGPDLQGYMSRYNVAGVFSRSIDSHYILSTLQSGYFFLFSFHLITVCMIYRYGKIAWAKVGPYAPLASGLFAASIVGTVTWLSVFLTWELGIIYIFYSGLACNLEVLERQRLRAAATDGS
ncbi:hypothetical protein EP7_003688 [Isosphaeraceae bacterium EP7]